MSTDGNNGPPKELTPEEFLRLCEEAKARGESTSPIIRRYVLQAIDGVIKHLEQEKDTASPE